MGTDDPRCSRNDCSARAVEQEVESHGKAKRRAQFYVGINTAASIASGVSHVERPAVGPLRNLLSRDPPKKRSRGGIGRQACCCKSGAASVVMPRKTQHIDLWQRGVIAQTGIQLIKVTTADKVTDIRRAH